MADVHHFRQTVNGGTLILPVTPTLADTTGGCIIRLTDLPFYQQMAPNFEFARLNKCKLEFWPKSNMQLTQLSAAGALSSFSVSGTFITAIDQVPFYSGTTSASNYVAASSWSNDGSNDSGVTSASFVNSGMSTDYIRGLQGSREKELYKKHTLNFYPAFYDYVMTGQGTGAITSVANVLPGATPTLTLNGCVERKIKKWVSINTISSEGNDATVNVGPLYFGPVYAIDGNVDGTGASSVPLYDVRFTYSISFKRVRGT